ncbi:MAG TPA: FtsX-like permease family protein [Actinomycetota bacterium]|nr:FtsX-like permease family protein [Actinomycetota bacterium]
MKTTDRPTISWTPGSARSGSSWSQGSPLSPLPGAPRHTMEFWKIPAASAVVVGVAFSVLLMSVAFGVQAKIDTLVGSMGAVPAQALPTHLIHQILLWLTIVITGAMLLQTALSTFTMGTALMHSRRDEIAIRRQSGVLRTTLLAEFARAMLGPCLAGGAVGEVVGILAGLMLRSSTVLPVHFTAISVLAAFPTTIVLALCATLVPAWQSANASPALLRKE